MAGFKTLKHSSEELTSPELITIQSISGLGDPNADRLLFWDESANDWAFLTAGTGLSITGTTLSASGVGDVTGPASSTDNAVARFDLTTGKLLQDSGATIDDSGNLTATNFSGSSSGTNTGDNATNTQYSGLVTNATHTGDATGSGALTVVAINGTSLAGLATGILKNTTTTGVPSIATGADLPAMTATVGGAVPTPPNNTTTFLRGDGTFAAPAGGGDMVLADAQSVTGLKTFDTTKLAVKGSSTGSTAVASANASANNYTITLPAATGTFALLESPSFTTPTLGVASATSINKVTLTAPATGSTLTIADGKTLTASNTLTFTGTDSSSVAFGTGGTVLYSGGALGTPSSGTVTNLTGTASININGTVGATTPTTIAGTTINATTGFRLNGDATSGKILVGDGTNLVLSTPTFPNASATSGKIIKSDGTNWVASTETYAAPGTTGNVLTSDGTNWTSAAPAGGAATWEKLGETTLGTSATTLSVSAFSARKNLKIVAHIFGATGSGFNAGIQFNSDTGNNYGFRYSADFAAATTGSANSSAQFSTGDVGGATEYTTIVIHLTNKTTAAKVGVFQYGQNFATPSYSNGAINWSNTAAQITTVTLMRRSGTGSYESGSWMTVYGSND